MAPTQRWNLAGGIAMVFAVFWLLARAHLQNVTIDEATTFRFFVGREGPMHWYAAANNHLLNTMGMRLSVALFGISHLSIRLPALLGALVYFAAVWRITRIMLPEGLLRFSVLLCLVFNPFVADYLVAARGYGLAVGFLLAAIAVVLPERPSLAALSAASLFLALSFAANFSFALACIAALITIAIHAWPVARTLRGAAALLIPGMVTTLLLPAYLVATWPAGQLWVGARSMAETFASLHHASMFEPNPHLVSPLLMPVLQLIGPWLIPTLLLFAASCAAVARPRLSEISRGARIAAGVVLLALGMHWIAFYAFSLLLPKDRTGLFVVPLVTLVAGAMAALPAPGALARRLQAVTTALFVVLASYFLLCTRLTYFEAWWWDAEVKGIYDRVAYYHHACGVNRVPTGWHYAPSLNFYLAMSGRETLAEFDEKRPYPDAELYVLHSAFDGEFLRNHGLEVLHRGAWTEILIAARPEFLRRCHGSP